MAADIATWCGWTTIVAIKAWIGLKLHLWVPQTNGFDSHWSKSLGVWSIGANIVPIYSTNHQSTYYITVLDIQGTPFNLVLPDLDIPANPHSAPGRHSAVRERAKTVYIGEFFLWNLTCSKLFFWSKNAPCYTAPMLGCRYLHCSSIPICTFVNFHNNASQSI